VCMADRHTDSLTARPMQIAQTNLQLYNQLREKGRPLNDLRLVHRAYELLAILYSGHYQADGKPFVAHGVGVASIMGELDQPTDILVAALLHNVYENADFGDGRGGAVTAARRELVRATVGNDVEELLVRFRALRVVPENVKQFCEQLPQRSELERRLICIDLADYLEKRVDLGVLYINPASGLAATPDEFGEELAAVATELGEPRLAEMLSSAFAAVAANRGSVPTELRPSDGRLRLVLTIPRSCRRRLSVRSVEAIPRVRDRVRLRTRLRALLGAVLTRSPG
jgi:HD domain